MTLFSLFLLTLGLSSCLSSTITSSDTTLPTSSTFEKPPKYLKDAKFKLWEIEKAFFKTPLKLKYSDYDLERTIEDFQKIIPPNDHIEITAECFMSLLINWFVANDQDLNHGNRETRVYHQLDLTQGTDHYGHPDIVIEQSEYGNVMHAMIIELKGFGKAWPGTQKWETQLCSYLLGYKQLKGKTAAGVISNMKQLSFYSCNLDIGEKECTCWSSTEFWLFGVQDPSYQTFQVLYLEEFLTYLKWGFNNF